MFGLFYPYGIVLQAVAIVHFIRRRPDTFWLWVILMGGGVGALVYIVAEIIPDATLLRGAFQAFPRRSRINALQAAIVDNPSVGNYEELGDLCLEDRQYARARECFDLVVAKTDATHAIYSRALCELALGDTKAAAADLEQVVARDPKHDYQRAAGLCAHALAQIGETERAGALFADVTEVSTLSETQFNYASFLAAQGRPAEARSWAEKILRKKATMPAYLRRRERPWFRKARGLLKRLPATQADGAR
jgi:hypothetical protein